MFYSFLITFFSIEKLFYFKPFGDRSLSPSRLSRQVQKKYEWIL